MTKLHRKTLTEPRIIMGLLRELLFAGGHVSVTYGDRCSLLLLDDIHEKSTRSRAENRSFTLRGEIPINVECGQTVDINAGFGRFKINCSCIVLQKDRHSLEIAVPQQIEMSDLRISQRLQVDLDPDKYFPVLIQTEGLHAEASLRLDDLSRTGLGGTLIVPRDFPVTHTTIIFGSLNTNEGELPIATIVARALKGPDTSNDSDTYQVGLRRDTRENPARESSSHDRRRNSRIAIDERIELIPLLRPKNLIVFQIANASVSGFSGNIHTGSADPNLPVGAQFRVSGSSLIVQLVAFDDSSYRFQIISGDERDLVGWLKTLSVYFENEIEIRSDDAREILRIFCESGSLSKNYLKAHRPFAKAMIQDLENESKLQFWIHRWISKRNNITTGHISAIKIGDNAWLLGDLSGSQNPSNKLPKTFIPLFFSSFKELCLTLQPCPRHFLLWVEGHPYWRKFEESIGQHAQHLLLADVRMGYTRLDTPSISSNSKRISSVRITAEDFITISKIRRELMGGGTLDIAAALDFDIDRFGSPQLRSGFRSSHQRYFRQYFECSFSDIRWLVVISGYPAGLSFNRIPESAWVFQLTSKAITEEAWDGLIGWVKKIGSELGVKVPSIRRIYKKTELWQPIGEHATLRCILGHPRIWEYYPESDT